METVEKEETQKGCYICENYKFKATWKGEELFTRTDNTVKYMIAKDSCGPIFMHHLCINKWNDYWKRGMFTSAENPVCPQCLVTKKRGWNYGMLGLLTFVLFYMICLAMCMYKCMNPLSQFDGHWAFDMCVNVVDCQCMWLSEAIDVFLSPGLDVLREDLYVIQSCSTTSDK